MSSCPNPIDFAARKLNFLAQHFENDFRSGYSPIDLQEKQEKDFHNVGNKGTHFIKKKQSCANINLKRTVGVSYVKETESQQLNVFGIVFLRGFLRFFEGK